MAKTTRPIDKSKRSNRRCINCIRYREKTRNPDRRQWADPSFFCPHAIKSIDYWSCCKHFQWDPDKQYKEE